MRLECGMDVIDKGGRSLGHVDQVSRSMFTGEIASIVIYSPRLQRNIYCGPEDVLSISRNKVRLDVTVPGKMS